MNDKRVSYLTRDGSSISDTSAQSVFAKFSFFSLGVSTETLRKREVGHEEFGHVGVGHVKFDHVDIDHVKLVILG